MLVTKSVYQFVFFGSDAICLPCLEFLHAGAGAGVDWRLLAVVSQPDRRQGRGQQRRANPVAAYAKEKGITLLQPEKPDASTVDWMREHEVDVSLVMAYGHYLGRSIRSVSRLGMYNFHASILPKYRGASPIETALASGETDTGVSFMQVERAMDAGAVADVQRVAIDPSDTSSSLREKLGQAVVPLLERVLPAILNQSLDWSSQVDSEATYCRKLCKADGWIDVSLSARAIVNRWRAFASWPGTYCTHREQRLKIGGMTRVDASDIPVDLPLPEAELTSGTLVRDADRLLVRTGKGWISLLELQRPGGKMLPVSEFLCGYRMETGDCLIGEKSTDLILRGASS